MHTLKTTIEFDKFRAEYDNFIALEIEHAAITGSIIAVVGHNGAGKSTLIKSILELMIPAAGQVSVSLSGADNRLILKPELHMAFCPENGSVFGDISVENYVKLWCRIKHRDARYYRKEGSKYIELLRLRPLMSKLGRELSKGQRRRVQTAIGFLCQPLFFLFDEPFDGLDVQKTSELADIIENNSDEMCFLVSSHRMDVVERLADVVIVLREGRIAACGPVDEVCRKLCSQSLVVSNVSDPGAVFSALKHQFPDCLINHVGNQIRVTGESLKEDDVHRLLQKHDNNGFQVKSAQPGLVDAMNYHLKGLEE